MTTKLSDTDWSKLRHALVEYANQNQSEPRDQINEDYFTDHQVLLDTMTDVDDLYRFLVVEIMTDDEGGPSTLYMQTSTLDILDIEFASITFDTMTAVWKQDGWNGTGPKQV